MVTASTLVLSMTTPPGVSFGPVSAGASAARASTSAHGDIRTGVKTWERIKPTLSKRRGAILRELIGKRIDLIRVLLLLGCLIIARNNLFLGGLLSLRCGCARGGRRRVSLDLLAAAPDGGFRSGRRSGLAFGSTSPALSGGFGGLCASGLLLGWARALGGWPAGR